MREMPQNSECVLNGSPFCALQNAKDCDKCALNKLDRDEKLLAAEDMLENAKALPADALDAAEKAETCALCRKKAGDPAEKTGKLVRFAQFDIGHKNPAAEVGTRLSGGYDRGSALTVPVQLPACSACARRIRTLNSLPKALGLFVALGGLVLVAVEPVRVFLTRYSRLLPIIVFLIFVCLGVIVDSIVKRLVSLRIERTMNARTRRIDSLSELVSRGWFVIGETGGVPPFAFTREKLDSGFMTGDDRAELLKTIAEHGTDGIERLKKGEAFACEAAKKGVEAMNAPAETLEETAEVIVSAAEKAEEEIKETLE